MQQSVAQAATSVKPIYVTLPFAWGFEDGAQGHSLYAGYTLFCGQKFLQYEQGWKAGQAARQCRQLN